MAEVFARVLCADGTADRAGLAERLGARVAGAAPWVHVPAPDRHRGPVAADPLLDAIRRTGATLAVVASPAHGRAIGIALGAAPTFVLHEAPCSVLVARDRGTTLDEWPRTIVVGVDGSAEAEVALDAAYHLAARFGSSLRAVVGTRDAHVDLDAARQLAPGLEEHPESAVELLTLLSEEADLVVVGSRGVRGLRSLGSVSERVAHDAHSSVLVVRPAR